MTRKTKAQWAVQKILNLVGIHGFFARPVFRGTLDFETFVKDSLEDTTYNPNEVIGAFKVLQKKMLSQLTKGFRIDIGEDFISLYPNCVLTMKDYKDKDGNDVAVTADMLKTSDLVTRIGCTVSNKFKKAFAADVEWEKVNKNGQVIDDDITQGNENVEDNTPSTIDPSTNNTPSGGDDGLGG